MGQVLKILLSEQQQENNEENNERTVGLGQDLGKDANSNSELQLLSSSNRLMASLMFFSLLS